ncbi:hypothetical protein M8J77_015325 [Diaphorina citri]|nr:hypothetical protein M8J77_015325 [Diaphorina citri]
MFPDDFPMEQETPLGLVFAPDQGSQLPRSGEIPILSRRWIPNGAIFDLPAAAAPNRLDLFLAALSTLPGISDALYEYEKAPDPDVVMVEPLILGQV